MSRVEQNPDDWVPKQVEAGPIPLQTPAYVIHDLATDKVLRLRVGDVITMCVACKDIFERATVEAVTDHQIINTVKRAWQFGFVNFKNVLLITYIEAPLKDTEYKREGDGEDD